MHVGKIISNRNKIHGGPPTIWLNTTGVSLRKVLHLCFSCERFRGGGAGLKCPIAEEDRRRNRKCGTSEIRVVCADFVALTVAGEPEEDR